MSKLIIKGGRKLSGEIRVSGAKNAALKIIPAAILSSEKIVVNNLPKIEDVDRSLQLIESLGGQVSREGNSASITAADIKTSRLDGELSKRFRASVMFVGPILARTGEVYFPHPGGCVIGAGKRPIDIFLEGFKKFGAEVSIEDEYYCLKASGLKGADYFFPIISVTGTESMMMTAVLAEGRTVLRNCAMEPEIVSLAEHLNRCGAKISGAGTPTMAIEGVEKISGGNFDVMPDRIQTGTFAIMAAATKSPLAITDCFPRHIEALLDIFDKIGVKYERGADHLEILSADNLKAYSIKTHEYPGFATDLQSPYTVLMTQAMGTSLIHETIYDRRLLFTDMLSQMGANIIMCDPHRVVVSGPAKLYGKTLTSPDLRAGMAMVIAGLIAEGRTEIGNIYQIERGYEDVAGKLKRLGADIERID